MQNFQVKIKENIVNRFFGIKRKGQITVGDESKIGKEPERYEEPEMHDYDKEYQKEFLQDTKLQKGEQKSEEHDYKGPVEVILEESPEPLETQDDREKELKKGQFGPGPAPRPRPSNGHNGYKEYPLDEDLQVDTDCPYCGGEWDEDTKAEYFDSGEVECPHCGELAVAGERRSKKQASQMTVYNKQGDRLFARKASKDDWILTDNNGNVYERGTPNEIVKAVDEGIEKGKYKTKGRTARVTKANVDSKDFPAMGKYNMIDVRWGKRYGEEQYVEISWYSAGLPRPTISEVEEFIGSLQNAVVFAKEKQKELGIVEAPREPEITSKRKAQLSETDPMQMTTGAPTSEIEKYKMTRKKIDEPINVIMTPSIERKDGPGTPIDPTYLAEQIVRGLRFNHYHTAQEGFNHIIRATKDITKEQIAELKELMRESGYDVSEQKGDIVKTG